MTAYTTIASDDLVRLTTNILHSIGVPHEAAALTATDLVSADMEGIPSHGVMLLPMYVARLRSGSVSKTARGTIVSERGGAVVLDAENGLGQVVAHRAAALASARAVEHGGLAAVAVRNAFHFGAAGRYARLIAEKGAVGIVMANTRPMMPAPGGAEPMLGNNPIAIALPTSGAHPVEVDMALSASAMGRIRLAAGAGRPIPDGWAVDENGDATTDAAAALTGMLLPAAGPKGFGLAFMVDLLCGGLSAGSVGAGVRPLYGSASEPYTSAQFFVAIDVAHFGNPAAFADLVRDQAARISRCKPARGVERVFAPGELASDTRRAGSCDLDPATRQALRALAADLDVEAVFLH